MKYYRQLLLGVACALPIAAFPPDPIGQLPVKMFLATSTLPQIEVPLGLMPVPDPSRVVFEVVDGRITWMAAEAFGALGTSYAMPLPEAWPEVRPTGITPGTAAVPVPRSQARRAKQQSSGRTSSFWDIKEPNQPPLLGEHDEPAARPGDETDRFVEQSVRLQGLPGCRSFC